jgi:hypothetical protein
MFLLLVLFVSCCLAECKPEWPDSTVIWVQHNVYDGKNFLNNFPVDALPAEIMAHYVARGYKLEGHAMTATISSYHSRQETYSWTLIKYAPPNHECVTGKK